jgi:RNA polymerase sigma-70 factor (ECF subfamily)
VTDADWIAERFEDHRAHLRAVAYRMLGSASEADDAVQEAWLRLSRADAGAVDNLGGWLTTVVGRVCLDMLRARRARQEQSADGWAVVASGARDGSRMPTWPGSGGWPRRS